MLATFQILDSISSDATHQLLVSHMIQVAIVAACCLVAARFFKRYSYFCYLLLFLGIAKCLIPPVVPGPLSFFAPSNSAVVQLDADNPGPTTTNQNPLGEVDQPQAGLNVPLPLNGGSSFPDDLADSDPQTGLDTVVDNEQTFDSESQESESTTESGLLSMKLVRLILPGLMLLGILGGVVLLVRFVTQLNRLRATVNQKLSQRWQPRLDKLSTKVGLGPVRLWVSEITFAPSAFGVIRPTVVMPSGLLKQASKQEIEMVMLHELMHVRRRDSLLATFQTLAVCLWWFNPLVWILSRNLSRQREICCDLDTVTHGDLDRSEYGHCLLNVMQQIPKTTKQIGFGISPFSQIKQRLENIMAQRKERNRLSRLLSTSALLMIAALLLPGASFPINNNHSRNSEISDATDQLKLYFETGDAIVEYLPRPYEQSSDAAKLKTVFPKKQQMSRPVVSPNGNLLAFASYQDNQRRLWVSDAEGNANAISPEQNSIEQIQWSPDGTQIAYRTRSTQSSALFLVNSDGSNHRKVNAYQGQYSRGLEMYDEFCWSPDGNSLAVAKVVEININIFGSMERVSRNSVLVIHHLDREGKDQRVEKLGLGDRQMISNLAWSPDNQWIAFVSDRKLKLISAEEDAEAKVLISDLAPGAKPVWSHDSQSLLVHSAGSSSPLPPGAKAQQRKSAAFWIVPLKGEPKQLPVDFDIWNYAWDNQNESILSTGRGHRLYQVLHDGTVNVLSEGTGFWSTVQLNPIAQRKRQQQELQKFQQEEQDPPARPDPPILRPEDMEFPEEKATTNDEGLPAITYPASRAGTRWVESADGSVRVSIGKGIEFNDIEYHISLTWTLLAIKDGKTIWSHHISAFWNHLEVTELELDDKSTKKVLAMRNKRREEMVDFVEYYDLESGELIKTAGGQAAPEGREFKVEPAWRGGSALNDEPLFQVVTTQEDWTALRRTLLGKDSAVPVEAFDPENQILVVIASGKATNCGGISPAAAFESDDQITVRLFRHTYQTDGKGQIEHPFGIFALPKAPEKKYVLQRNQQGYIRGPEIWKTMREFRIEP